MQLLSSRLFLFIFLQSLLFLSLPLPVYSDVLLPAARRTVEQRKEKHQYRESIRICIEELNDLPWNAEHSLVKDVVGKLREALNAYNRRYHHPELTRSKFKQDFERMLLIKRANGQYWDQSRHSLRRYQRQICAMMFPEHPKSQKYKFCASVGEGGDEQPSIGAALARDIGWCAGGTGLLFFPHAGIKNLGWAMIGNGSYGIWCTSVNRIYPAVRDYQQIPATPIEREYLRRQIEDRHGNHEPLHNMRFEE